MKHAHQREQYAKAIRNLSKSQAKHHDMLISPERGELFPSIDKIPAKT